MTIKELAEITNKIEELVDLHGWNAVIRGVRQLLREQYNDGNGLGDMNEMAMERVRSIAASICPSAPGSRPGRSDHAG